MDEEPKPAVYMAESGSVGFPIEKGSSRFLLPLSMRDTARCIYAYLGFRVEGFPEPLTAPAVRSGFTRGVQTATKFQFFTKATSNM